MRNVAHYSPPVLAPDPTVPAEWETLLRLAAVAAGQAAPDDVAPLDDRIAGELAQRAAGAAGAPALLAATAQRSGPERLLDILLRSGPYELTLADLEAAPHGIDLGPLTPRLPDVLRTPSGRIELAPPEIVADVARLRAALAAPVGNGLVLVGPPPAALQQLVDAQPAAARLGTRAVHAAGAPGRRRAPRAGGRRTSARERARRRRSRRRWRSPTPSAPASSRSRTAGATTRTAPGSASPPRAPAINSNVLADEELVDVPSGNAVLNGIPVTLAPAGAAVSSATAERTLPIQVGAAGSAKP